MEKENIIGANLIKFRKEAGFTQARTANLMGATYSTYSGWERSVCKPSIKWLIRIANYYNILVDDLVGADSWKTVKKQLPEVVDTPVKVRVFAVMKGNEINAEGEYYDGKFTVDGTDITKYVTHWRPIPKSPSK